MPQNNGKIIYTCPYVPAEWIAAHSLSPCRLTLNAADVKSIVEHRQGLCPYVKSFINEVMTNNTASAVIVTTLCDQMRRAFDIITNQTSLPAFLLNVPHTWQDISAVKLYLDELKRLGKFLCTMGGKSPSNDILAEIMLNYDSNRKAILDAKDFLPSRRFSETIAEFNYSGKCNIEKETPESPQGVPLAILGGPLTKEAFEIFDIVKNAGGNIILDATETGERGLCAGFDRRQLRHDPLTELANAYFYGIVDASRRPDSELYNWVKQKLIERPVKGIIFYRYIWCDAWHAELSRLKQWSKLPILDLDTPGDEPLTMPRISQRISAFMEILR